ncbi:hypothetical protein ACFY7C_36575 [Streptomyces sp. NPDC012769]
MAVSHTGPSPANRLSSCSLLSNRTVPACATGRPDTDLGILD